MKTFTCASYCHLLNVAGCIKQTIFYKKALMEVRNFRVTKLNYEIELRKMTSHFVTANLRLKNKNFHSELLARKWKRKSFSSVTNSVIKLLFFRFGVTNSNLKCIKLHFKLLTQSRLILEIQFYPCPVPLEGHREKTSQFFWSPTKPNYLYIIISYSFQPLFFKLSLLLTRKPRT